MTVHFIVVKTFYSKTTISTLQWHMWKSQRISKVIMVYHLGTRNVYTKWCPNP